MCCLLCVIAMSHGNRAVRIARTSFTASQVAANVVAATESIINHIPRKWKNIQAMYIKTTTSTALPIFTSLPTVPTSIVVKDKTSQSVSKQKSVKPTKAMAVDEDSESDDDIESSDISDSEDDDDDDDDD